jgi:hypothetical protein
MRRKLWIALNILVNIAFLTGGWIAAFYLNQHLRTIDLFIVLIAIVGIAAILDSYMRKRKSKRK